MTSTIQDIANHYLKHRCDPLFAAALRNKTRGVSPLSVAAGLKSLQDALVLAVTERETDNCINVAADNVTFELQSFAKTLSTMPLTPTLQSLLLTIATLRSLDFGKIFAEVVDGDCVMHTAFATNPVHLWQTLEVAAISFHFAKTRPTSFTKSSKSSKSGKTSVSISVLYCKAEFHPTKLLAELNLSEEQRSKVLAQMSSLVAPPAPAISAHTQ